MGFVVPLPLSGSWLGQEYGAQDEGKKSRPRDEQVHGRDERRGRFYEEFGRTQRRLRSLSPWKGGQCENSTEGTWVLHSFCTQCLTDLPSVTKRRDGKKRGEERKIEEKRRKRESRETEKIEAHREFVYEIYDSRDKSQKTGAGACEQKKKNYSGWCARGSRSCPTAGALALFCGSSANNSGKTDVMATSSIKAQSSFRCGSGRARMRL